MPRPLLPTWLRRGFEAAIVAAVVAIASLWGDRLVSGAGPFPLPSGPTGAILLAPAVVALGVLTSAYPIVMATTRGDAVMGAIAAFLVAADLVIVFTPSHVSVDRLGLTVPGGVLVGLLGIAPAAAGLVGSQVGASLGFGRRAGAIAAVVSAVAALIVLVGVALVV